MPNDSFAERRTVRLVDVPLDLYSLAQQHTDDLLREVVLMAAHDWARGEAAGAAASLAERLEGHRDGRLELAVAAAPDLDAAGERGDTHVTLTYTVPRTVATSSEEWSLLLDELESLCDGGTLLSVPGSDEVRAFSRWFCSEFAGQLRDRRPPCPWPEYERRTEATSRT